MSNIREETLSLRIDSTKAAAGARQFEQAANQVQGAATRTEKAVGGLDRAFKSAALTLGTYFTTRMLTRGMGALLRLASDAEEVGSKFNVVFADLAGSADAWASSFADSVGRAETETKRAMANAGDLFKPLGFAVDDALELSKALVGLSVDVASFNNAMDAEVMRDFQSALVGNHETVRKYGIVISESTLEQEAFRRGLHKSYKDLSDQQKVLLRYSMILKGSADAQGDAIRTGDSYANQVKRLKAALSDAGTELGSKFLPVASNALKTVNDFFEQNSGFFKRWASDIAEGCDIAGGAVVDVFELMAQAPDAFLDKLSRVKEALDVLPSSARMPIVDPTDPFGSSARGTYGSDVDELIRQVAAGNQSPVDFGPLLSRQETAVAGTTAPATPTVSPPSGPDLSAMLEKAGTDGASAYTGPGAMYPSAEDAEAYWQTSIDYMNQDIETRKRAADEMANMEQAVQREMEIIGRLSDSHAHAADMIEYATLANERYGEGTDEAAAATAKFERSLKRLSRQEKLVNMAEDISRAFGQTFADLLTGAATVEDAFESLGNTIIATMAQKMIADPITNAMMGAFGGLFGAPVMHSGGVVGQTATPVRIVNSSIFAGAPRLHTGLRDDEYPAILQRGEQVIPKRESEFMASAPNVSFNITNQSGAQVDVQQTGVQWDGRRMIVGMVLKDKRNNGPMARANRRR